MSHDFLIGAAIGLAIGIFVCFGSIVLILYIDHRKTVRRRRGD